jgi:hypothetical protein
LQGSINANNTFVTIATTLVDIVKLSDDTVVLKFFKENLPIVLACIFDGVFCPFVRSVTNNT